MKIALGRRGMPRRTVRLRMTLLYGCLFLASGAVLLAVTYVLVRHAVSDKFKVQGDQSQFKPAPGSTGGAGSLAPPSGAPGFHSTSPGTGMSQSTGSGAQEVPSQVTAALARQKEALLHQLLVQSGIALVFMAAVAMVLGWTVAGRVLHPLQMITRTVRRISATNLHERLELTGPDDEMKELGDTFNGLLGRLQASFAAQRRFVANASHELRTPLARQRVIGQLAVSDPEADLDSLREAHERILLVGEQQERMIEALLTLARGHAGIEVPQPFDLTAIVREALAARAAEAAVREVRIRSSLAEAEAIGHGPLAERLVGNLIDNAIRYNVGDGLIEVTTETVADRATLTVTNTGPLVSDEDVDRLFQPFQRLGTARTRRRSDGLGLGLSIVQAIAEAHEAVLTVTPRPDGGLTVMVAFPTAAALPEQGGRSDAPELSVRTAARTGHRPRR